MLYQEIITSHREVQNMQALTASDTVVMWLGMR